MNFLNVSLFCQFVCATIVHLQNAELVTSCLKIMKFSLNHPYVFKTPSNAFIAVLLKFKMAIYTEMGCILVIVIGVTPLEIVMNFIAIYVVA